MHKDTSKQNKNINVNTKLNAELEAVSAAHEHEHECHHKQQILNNQEHGHIHKHSKKVISIRAATGLSGDILLTGLARLGKTSPAELNELLKNLNIAELENCLELSKKNMNSISGWQAQINLPQEHAHRHLPDILALIEKSQMSKQAKHLAKATFELLGQAEANVHGCSLNEIAFHEVGALDSILDICMVCALFDRLNPSKLVVSPLPLCDGIIHCAHGILASPAPAVLELLKGVAVKGLKSSGETLTPTALALIKTLGAEFGEWPSMQIEEQALVYGTKYFVGVPNGVIFAYGSLL